MGVGGAADEAASVEEDGPGQDRRGGVAMDADGHLGTGGVDDLVDGVSHQRSALVPEGAFGPVFGSHRRQPRGVSVHIGTDRASYRDRKSTRLNSSHVAISYAVFCLKKKTHPLSRRRQEQT